MTNSPRICVVCHTEIPEGVNYACVWEERVGKLFVTFAHLKCSEQFEDITDEVTGKGD